MPTAIQAVTPSVELLPLHGATQQVDVRQPVLELKQEYLPIAKRVDGVQAYKEVNRILSQRLWIC